jgi:hypothetical protein
MVFSGSIKVLSGAVSPYSLMAMSMADFFRWFV